MSQRRYHFTTRDLLMMAALAAMGGVTSTYVNAVGDIFQSVTGFAGTTQWAAGLHVLWLTLAVGPVSYTHLTLPTTLPRCRSRWSPYH